MVMRMTFQDFQDSREKKLSKSLGVVQLMDKQAMKNNRVTLPWILVGRLWLFERSEIEKWVRENRQG